MSDKAILLGKDFRALITAVTKFPSVGAFAGSELISLHTNNSYLVATSLGIVLSKCRVAATGSLSLLAADERILQPFAPLCSDTVKVVLTVEDKTLTLKAGRNETKVGIAPGQEHKIPKLKDVLVDIPITDELSTKLRYLAEVAFNDTSRPELNCVMLTDDGRAVAVNQKCIAALKLSSKDVQRVALPVPITKILSKGDRVHVCKKETLVQSGHAWYLMPSPVRAQKEFPLASVDQVFKTIRAELAGCSGSSLAKAVAACDSVLGNIARTEMVVKLDITDSQIELFAENGGASFRSNIKAITKGEGQLMAPLQELLHIAPLIEAEERLTLARGKHGEMFLQWSSGWCMFPSWKEK